MALVISGRGPLLLVANNGVLTMSGILYAIGVGPGDPELLTLKAVRIIKESDVIVIPQKKEECRAYGIAVKAVPEIKDKEIIDTAFPMTNDQRSRDDLHRDIFEKIKEQTEKGRNVAFLTIGDPAVYSTFSYINDLAKKDGIVTEMISGVTSASACAGSLNIDLCIADEPLHIFPGADNIEEALKLGGTKVIMKGGKDISKIKQILEKDHSDAKVFAVSHCGCDNETRFYSLEELSDDAGYLTTVMIKD